MARNSLESLNRPVLGTQVRLQTPEFQSRDDLLTWSPTVLFWKQFSHAEFCLVFWFFLSISLMCPSHFFLLFSLILNSKRVRGSFWGEVDERDGNLKGRLSPSSRQNRGTLTLVALLPRVQDTKNWAVLAVSHISCALFVETSGKGVCIYYIYSSPRSSSNPFLTFLMWSA